jgi:hypothetical protein
VVIMCIGVLSKVVFWCGGCGGFITYVTGLAVGWEVLYAGNVARRIFRLNDLWGRVIVKDL